MESGHNGYNKVIIGAIISLLSAILLTTIFGALSFWKDAGIGHERQRVLIEDVRQLRELLSEETKRSMSADQGLLEMQYQQNRLRDRLQVLERREHRPEADQ